MGKESFVAKSLPVTDTGQAEKNLSESQGDRRCYVPLLSLLKQSNMSLSGK